MKAVLLPSSTDNTAKFELTKDGGILVIDQASTPAYTNPTVSISLPKPFKGAQAIDMFLTVMNIQETKYTKMIERVGKKSK